MKKFLEVVFIAILFTSSQAECKASPGPSFLGTWAVDISRLPLPPEARPQRVTVSFSQAKPGQLATRVEVIDATGSVLYADSVTTLDGTPAPVLGNLEADTAAATMPSPSVLVMQLARANVPGSTRIYTFAPDGKSMTETAANFGDDGNPVMRINYFSRIK